MQKMLLMMTVCLLGTVGVAAAEVVSRVNWVPTGAYNLGDVWTFSCPAGGSFDLTVDTFVDGSIDPLFQVKDSTGLQVVVRDDVVPCLPASCFQCPQVLASPCLLGGTYSILVSAGPCGTASGGSYELSLEVKDAASVALTAKKAKLGGGPRSKVPAWHSATTNPAIDDGKLE